jgi:surface protein
MRVAPSHDVVGVFSFGMMVIVVCITIFPQFIRSSPILQVFYQASVFNGNISTWDVASVTSMGDCKCRCYRAEERWGEIYVGSENIDWWVGKVMIGAASSCYRAGQEEFHKKFRTRVLVRRCGSCPLHDLATAFAVAITA